MIFIGALVGYILGDLLIGGVLFALFGQSPSPSGGEKAIFSWVGRIIGLFIGIAITI